MTPVPAAAAVVAAVLVSLSVVPDDLFRVRGAGDDAVVSADRAGVPCDHALEELCKAMAWRIQFQSDRLRAELSQSALDLAFEDQRPRTVAHLLAVAGGADVVFNDTTRDGQHDTALVVVSPPSAGSDTGRQRLRQWAIRWYRMFLREDLSAVPALQSAGLRVRMQMAQLLKEQGALQESARAFLSVYEDDPAYDFVPTALLRVAECNFELGPDHWAECERWARELARLHPALPETAAGTVLLGRLLLAQGRHAECVKYLTSSYLRLSGTPEIVDLYLLVGEAWFHLAEPSQVLATIDTLDGASEFREFRTLREAQWLEYLFLRGYALERLGRAGEAALALELLIGTGPDYGRRAQAFVLLGFAYLEAERYLEARAAAVMARKLKAGLDRDWARDSSRLYAEAAIRIGNKDEAFEDLEVEVRASPEAEPELVLYLMQAFVEDGRFQKAIDVAGLLADDDGEWGDQARFGRIDAMWRQARSSGSVEGFPARVLPLAARIVGEDRQRAVAEMIGRAYQMAGQIEKAADAYRGVLR